MYIASYLAVSIPSGARAFGVVAGVILGICAVLPGTLQGYLMLAYPTEAQKGMFQSIFMIKNHTDNYVPSMGTAVVWRTDAVGIAYMNRRSAL